ncbi:MAG: hypothetical protein ABWY93_22625 [Mycobacterium sp.]
MTELYPLLTRVCKTAGTISLLLTWAHYCAAQPAMTIYFFGCTVLLFFGALKLGE